MQIDSTDCCGVRQLYNIEGDINEPTRGPKYILQEVARAAGPQGNRKAAFYIFYDHRANQENSYGQRLAAFIRENNVGELVESPIRLNPNSNNMLKMYTWAIDVDQLVLRFRPKMRLSAQDYRDAQVILSASQFNLGDFVKFGAKGRTVLAGRVADDILNLESFRVVGGVANVGIPFLKIEIQGRPGTINIGASGAKYFVKGTEFESNYEVN